ncbi:MAG: hypothetical protein RR576_00585 [Oscillospiraceae bacterium]
MINESYPWKQDLQRRKNLMLKNNTAENFEKNNDGAYTIIEKTIFYSAFIIRKLIDCNSKLSDEADNYSLTVFAIDPLKRVDSMHRWPEEDSHDWENEKEITILGKVLCNSLIHSYLFFTIFNDSSVIDSFCVSSDYDKNKVLYRVPLAEWIKYINFIVSDDIIRLDSRYSPKHADYIYTRKERGKL